MIPYYVRNTVLLIAGSLISILIKPGEDFLIKFWIWLFIEFLLFCIIGINGEKSLVDACMSIKLFFNKRQSIVGIYAPYEITDENSSWINIKLNDIYNLFSVNQIKFIQLNHIRKFAQFPILINPYGGVYPEINVASQESLSAIFNYVKNGGIYINIADIPFYYAYDEDLHRRIDTTPMIPSISTVPLFFDTLFATRFHTQVFNKSVNPNIERVMGLQNKFINLYSPTVSCVFNGNIINCSPIVGIPYGRGHFIFSTIVVNNSNIYDLINLISKAKDLMRNIKI